MRFAILSDIHSNLEALQAVLDRQSVTVLIQQCDKPLRDVAETDEREVGSNRSAHSISSNTSPTRSRAEVTCPGWLPKPIRKYPSISK